MDIKKARQMLARGKHTTDEGLFCDASDLDFCEGFIEGHEKAVRECAEIARTKEEIFFEPITSAISGIRAIKKSIEHAILALLDKGDGK